MPETSAAFWCGATLTAFGLIFSVWARRHLGRNWSGAVTIKKGHDLITTGPYGIVRHPIYSGLITAFIGSAIGRGEWRGLVAVLLATTSFYWKLHVEERWMFQQFGGAYSKYCDRVPMLMTYFGRRQTASNGDNSNQGTS